MQVQLSLKEWRVVQDEKTKCPKVVGRYTVMMGEKEIACQEFNGGYSCKEVPFSDATINAILQIEAVIKGELERLLS